MFIMTLTLVMTLRMTVTLVMTFRMTVTVTVTLSDRGPQRPRDRPTRHVAAVTPCPPAR
jgi:hypothetical protein